MHFGRPTAHSVPANNHIFVSDCFLVPDLWLAPLQLKSLAAEMPHLLFLFLSVPAKVLFAADPYFPSLP